MSLSLGSLPRVLLSGSRKTVTFPREKSFFLQTLCHLALTNDVGDEFVFSTRRQSPSVVGYFRKKVFFSGPTTKALTPHRSSKKSS